MGDGAACDGLGSGGLHLHHHDASTPNTSIYKRPHHSFGGLELRLYPYLTRTTLTHPPQPHKHSRSARSAG